MDYRLSRCDFQEASVGHECSYDTMYRVTLVSSDGPTCEMLLCGRHADRSWQLGAGVLHRHFPLLHLTLATVQMHPVCLSRNGSTNFVSRK
jgi:hypothetical protein